MQCRRIKYEPGEGLSCPVDAGTLERVDNGTAADYGGGREETAGRTVEPEGTAEGPSDGAHDGLSSSARSRAAQLIIDEGLSRGDYQPVTG